MGLKGCRLWAMGQLDSTCRAPPRSPKLCGGSGSGSDRGSSPLNSPVVMGSADVAAFSHSSFTTTCLMVSPR
jgi:hypothetical protein